MCETAAVAQPGTEVWSRRFPDPLPPLINAQDDAVQSLYVNGTIIVAGNRTIAGTSYFQVVKYNTDGTDGTPYSTRWPATSKAGIQRKVIAAVATREPSSQLSKVFVAGVVPSGPSLQALTVQVVAFDGDTLATAWSTPLPTGMNSGETVLVAIAADDTRVGITYSTRLGTSGVDITTVLLDQSDGTTIYGPTTFSSAGMQTDQPVGIVFDSHSPGVSRFYVAGTYPSPVAGHGQDYIAIGYDYLLPGTLPLWTTSIGDVDHHSVASGIVSNAKSNGVYLTGTTTARYNQKLWMQD